MNIKIQCNTFQQKKSKVPQFTKQQSLASGPNSSITKIEYQGQKRILKRVSKQQTLNEVHILQQLDHPNILKLYEFYEDNNDYCLITDFWDGGDLYEYLGQQQSIDEYEIAEIMKQLLSVLKYIHSKKIVHRDIKSENILVEKDNTEGILIKLIDWGVAIQMDNSKTKLHTTIGTPYYMAPEVFRQSYNEKCDLWSTGVLLYEITTGELPFYARQAEEIQRKIIDTKLNFDHPKLKECSSDLVDLLGKLLIKDPEKRFSAGDALQHQFLSRKRRKSQEFCTNFLDSVNRLLQSRVKNRFQQAVLSYLGRQQTIQNEKNLIRVFNEIDKDGDGKLTCDELSKALQQIFQYDELHSEMQAHILMDQLDLDNNGSLEYSEFVAACSQRQLLLTESNLKLAFQQFDLNGDGVISINELKSVLQCDDVVEEERLNELIQDIDSNGDGEVKEWKDVEPISQFNGKVPILNIKYDPDYIEYMDYFRAIVISKEISQRVFNLTTIVIGKLPSNYNAFFIRRQCLFQLNMNLNEELDLMSDFIFQNEKVYQVWEHRRQIIEKLNDYSKEFDFLKKIFNSDNKNYHGWSYRIWLCDYFKLHEIDLQNIEYYIEEDIGNNSVWNYRSFLLSKIQFNFDNEFEYIKNKIRIKPDNEATWNYLRGWFKLFQFPGDTINQQFQYQQFNMDNYNLYEFLEEIGNQNRFALSLKQQWLLLHNDKKQALELCTILENIDQIRIKYWEFVKKQIEAL